MAEITQAVEIVLVVTTATGTAFLIEYSVLRLILGAMFRGLPRNGEFTSPRDAVNPPLHRPGPQSGSIGV